jgi:hypothetical protein
MRFLTLTSIAALAFASVSASSVDSFKDVGHTGEEPSPLLKRADQVNGGSSPTPVAGGANGIEKAKIGATPQGLGSLSKRHKKSKDDPNSGEQQGDGAASDANSDAPRQVPGSLSKRHKKSKDDPNSGKQQGGDAPSQVPGSLSKRHKKSKDDPNSGKQQGDGAASGGDTGATSQVPGSFSKRAEQANGNVPPGNGQTTDTSGAATANGESSNPSEYGV